MVGTYVPPLLADGEQYSMIIPQDRKPSAGLLQFLHRFLAIGLVEAKTRIMNEDVVIADRNAVEVFRLRQQLEDARIHYCISPSFPY
jgi:hypothetical protein